MSIEPPLPAVSRPSRMTTMRWSRLGDPARHGAELLGHRLQELSDIPRAELALVAHPRAPCRRLLLHGRSGIGTTLAHPALSADDLARCLASPGPHRSATS